MLAPNTRILGTLSWPKNFLLLKTMNVRKADAMLNPQRLVARFHVQVQAESTLFFSQCKQPPRDPVVAIEATPDSVRSNPIRRGSNFSRGFSQCRRLHMPFQGTQRQCRFSAHSTESFFLSTVCTAVCCHGTVMKKKTSQPAQHSSTASCEDPWNCFFFQTQAV